MAHANYLTSDQLGHAVNMRDLTRYISPTVIVRSHTSAELPSALEDYAGQVEVDDLVVPGLVYRRDAVERSTWAEPYQVDL